MQLASDSSQAFGVSQGAVVLAAVMSGFGKMPEDVPNLSMIVTRKVRYTSKKIGTEKTLTSFLEDLY